jgi:methionyl-tRNA formyltransferase
VSYGKILPKYILNFPKYGCINVHASLLPKYRGAAPIQRCIIDGVTETGVTTMLMDSKLDTGDIILQHGLKILEGETYGELHDRLAALGFYCLTKTLEDLEKGAANFKKQDNSTSSYAKKIEKTDAIIDWSVSAKNIVNLIRGLNPIPGAKTVYCGGMMKIFHAHAARNYNIDKRNVEFGEILEVFDGFLAVKAADGVVLVEEIQFPGKTRICVKDYMNGHKFKIGEILGQKC